MLEYWQRELTAPDEGQCREIGRNGHQQILENYASFCRLVGKTDIEVAVLTREQCSETTILAIAEGGLFKD